MYIGIDLGGTNIAGGLVNDYGEILYRMNVPTYKYRGYDAVVNDIGNMIMDIIEKYERDYGSKDEILGVGIGVPGVVSSDLRHVHYCPNLDWHDEDLSEDILRKFKDINIPVFVENDANLAALAELEAGSLKSVSNGVMLTLGTGIGGGIIVDSRMLRGCNGISSEIGHIIIGENFYDCKCGNNGCFETFASATAVVKYAEKLLIDEKYKNTRGYNFLSEFDNLKLYNPDYAQMKVDRLFGAKEVIDLAKQGDELAMDVFNRLVKYLGIGLVNIIYIFDPQKISFGGGLAYAGDFLLDAVKKEIDKKHFIKDFPFAELVLATFGNNAGIVGSGMLAKTEL